MQFHLVVFASLDLSAVFKCSEIVSPPSPSLYIGISHALTHAFALTLSSTQSVVLDMHYSSDSTDHREIRDLREIISTLYKVNRTHPEPFNIHLCNFDKSSLG